MGSLERSLICTAFVFGIAACSTQPIRPELVARIERVGVISSTARDFTRQYVGVMAFGNQKDVRDISAWDVDAAYEERIAAALESIARWKVVRAPFAREQFAHVNDPYGLIDYPLFWDPNWAAIREVAKGYCGANALDAIVFVTRERSQDFIGGTNQRIEGAGIYSRGDVDVLHLVSRIDVFDCSSLQSVLSRSVLTASHDSAGKTQWSRPMEDLPGRLARKPIPQWTPEDEDRIRLELIALPDRAWTDTLGKIFPQPAK